MINKNEIYKITNEYLNKHKLYDYLNDIKFVTNETCPYGEDIVGAYIQNKKFILFNTDQLENNDYLYTIYALYHELTHVKQTKIRKSETTEAQLFNDDYQIQKENFKFYIDNYADILIEYNADVEARIQAMNYTNIDTKKDVFNDISYYYENNRNTKLKKLYAKRELLEKFNKIAKNCSYEDTKKILLGLPIEKETFNKIQSNDQELFNEISKKVL